MPATPAVASWVAFGPEGGALAAAAADGLVVGIDAHDVVWRRDPNDAGWVPCAELPGVAIVARTGARSVALDAPTGVPFVTRGGTLLRGAADCSTWTVVTLPRTGPVLRVAAAPGAARLLLAVTPGGVSRSSDGGATWTRGADLAIGTTPPLVAIGADGHGVVIANARARCSADGGGTFRELAAGSTGWAVGTDVRIWSLRAGAVRRALGCGGTPRVIAGRGAETSAATPVRRLLGGDGAGTLWTLLDDGDVARVRTDDTSARILHLPGARAIVDANGVPGVLALTTQGPIRLTDAVAIREAHGLRALGSAAPVALHGGLVQVGTDTEPIARSADGGTTWTAPVLADPGTTPGAAGRIVAVDGLRAALAPTSPTAAPQTPILVTTNGGASWRRSTVARAPWSLGATVVGRGRARFAVVGATRQRLLTSADAGATWRVGAKVPLPRASFALVGGRLAGLARTATGWKLAVRTTGGAWTVAATSGVGAATGTARLTVGGGGFALALGGSVFRSSDLRHWHADGAGLPALPATAAPQAVALADAASGAWFLVRGDGVWRQPVAGGAWTRLAGSPAAARDGAIAGGRLFVLGSRGPEAVPTAA